MPKKTSLTRREVLAHAGSLAAGLTLTPMLSARPTEAALAEEPTNDGLGVLTLWYTQPATDAINEGLPIGNGRLGAMVFGGTAVERVQFNEDSLWTGDENPSGDYDSMGAYQKFGDLEIAQRGHEAATEYHRALHIDEAVARVQYRVGDVTYRREYFSSHPAQVLAVRLTADKPGRCTGTVALADAHGAATVSGANRLTASGALGNGMRYESQALVLSDGGTMQDADGKVAFQNCDSVTILLAAGTDYVMDAHRNWRGEPPHAPLTGHLAAASAKSYAALKAAHVADYQALFGRVVLDLGPSPAARRGLPTDLRKAQNVAGDDPELEQLLFQYGRYLLISCSRPGGLPANLQGLWNDSNSPPWHCDYHANINVQMNYWPAEPTNLAECHVPFIELIQSQLEPWRKATQTSSEYKLTGGAPVRGWALRTSHNITGGMGWNWDKTANAWYCSHLWEHFAFGGDKGYLKNVAYPILKETCEFWEDHLKAQPDGRLVVPNGWSPEHGPVEDGVSYNQEIVWDLFTNFLAASEALGADHEYRAKITGMRDQLVTPQIGHWGQLQEWMTDRDDPNDHHRHTSHLFAVYPGHQISTTGTPALAAAAKVSLVARGDTGDVREWSYAWRTALYARLNDGEAAHRQLTKLLTDANTLPNLIGDHPPAQWDGNFGITAGIAEMLMQSQSGEIALLPGLPAAWPTGSVTGLRARGGFEVSLLWAAGKLKSATIHSVGGSTCRVRYAGKAIDLRLKPGGRKRLDAVVFI